MRFFISAHFYSQTVSYLEVNESRKAFKVMVKKKKNCIKASYIVLQGWIKVNQNE